MKTALVKKPAVVLALVLAAGVFFSMPVMAEPETGTDAATPSAAVATQEATNAADQKEAEAIARYGTYTGENAKKIPVITYHIICSDSQKKNRYPRTVLAISQSVFDKQMKYLHRKGYRSINCEEMYLWHEGKIKLPPKSVLITFDDGHPGVVKYALPVLEKYKMKGTSFIIGKKTYQSKSSTYISYKKLKSVQKKSPYLEFQSHTYNLHKHISKKSSYAKVTKDAAKQKKYYNFEYLAYPYGRYNAGMIKAYKESGIKMAFTYGKNGYATRTQNLYKIRRIKVYAKEPFSKFTRWFK